MLLSQANYVLAQFRNEKLSEWIISLRRQINAQKRYLVNHAAFLANEIPELTADIDHNQIASAFDNTDDPEAALRHWTACVAKSPNETICAYNLRGFARFLFGYGNPQQARQMYEEALRVSVPDHDRARFLRADTYLLWSRAEKESGFFEEARHRRDQAIAEADRIGQTNMRERMLEAISLAWNESQMAETAALPLSVDPEPKSES